MQRLGRVTETRSNYSQSPAWYFNPGRNGSANDCILNYVGFQASAVKLIRSVLFWDITQRIVVIPYRRFGTTYLSYLQGSNPRLVSLTLADETDKLSRNVGSELIRCVISQKSANLTLN